MKTPMSHDKWVKQSFDSTIDTLRRAAPFSPEAAKALEVMESREDDFIFALEALRFNNKELALKVAQIVEPLREPIEKIAAWADNLTDANEHGHELLFEFMIVGWIVRALAQLLMNSSEDWRHSVMIALQGAVMHEGEDKQT